MELRKFTQLLTIGHSSLLSKLIINKHLLIFEQGHYIIHTKIWVRIIKKLTRRVNIVKKLPCRVRIVKLPRRLRMSG